MRVEALIFDFDGVLLESEWAGTTSDADYLTGIGIRPRRGIRCTF